MSMQCLLRGFLKDMEDFFEEIIIVKVYGAV